jgi:hypothetical protein
MDERSARSPRRLAREEKTIAAMIALYCRDHHAGAASPAGESADAPMPHDESEAAFTRRGEPAPAPAQGGEPAAAAARRGDDGLCSECAELLAYARLRLAKCRYGVDKPTCANCETHCYKPATRERVRVVMRYSGPRMLKLHPVLAVAHLVDGRKTPSEDS